MGLLNIYKILLLAVLSIVLTACPGPRGSQGLPGVGGEGGKIISTLNCGGTIVGQTGPASVLNGLEIEYDAVLLSSGDVYATAVVIDSYQQVSGTAFYAANQVGAQTALVLVTADHHGVGNRGLWKVSLDRSSLETTIVYDDLSLSSPVNMTFNPSACTVQYW